MTESRLKKSLNCRWYADDRSSQRWTQVERRSQETIQFVSSQERRKMWSDEWNQISTAKSPAEVPGWHLIAGLSTTNAYDTIDKRVRLGYMYP